MMPYVLENCGVVMRLGYAASLSIAGKRGAVFLFCLCSSSAFLIPKFTNKMDDLYGDL
jgi:hypothetical protein